MQDRKMHRYDNLIDYPRPVAQRPMSELNRAAQFSPFAALVGFGEQIDETARLTKKEIELTDNEREALDYKLSEIIRRLEGTEMGEGIKMGEGIGMDEAAGPGGESGNSDIRVTYFVPDGDTHQNSLKEGGEYVSHSGTVKKVDMVNRFLIFEDSVSISLDRIVDMEIS